MHKLPLSLFQIIGKLYNL